MSKNNESADSNDTKVSVSFPEELEVNMVQANELKHYELFQWLIILLAPIASGFWTAYATDKSSVLWWSALVFSLITLLFGGIALFYRKKLFHGSIKKSIKLSELK